MKIENYKNNFIKKLTQREIGFIYILLYVAFGYLGKISFVSEFLISLHLSFLFSIIIFILRIWLLINGLIKIFSKENNETNTQQKDFIVNRKRLVESIVYIILGILGAISFFLTNFFCRIALNETNKDNCGFILIYSSIILVPITIGGIVFIIVGIVKLNKYFRYIKSQKIFIENK